MLNNTKNSVRPNNLIPRKFLAKIISLVRAIFGGDRFEGLYRAVFEEISAITELQNKKISLLDYGCGVMAFSRRLHHDGITKSVLGIDIFPFSAVQEEFGVENSIQYKQIPEGKITNTIGYFDLTILLDVLHHAPDHEQLKILVNLSKISEYILVKDHFEYGFISRQLLRLADWYGNYAYGVTIPKSYFNPDRWQKLITAAKLKEHKISIGIRVHHGIFGLIIPPKFHFISILTR